MPLYLKDIRQLQASKIGCKFVTAGVQRVHTPVLTMTGSLSGRWTYCQNQPRCQLRSGEGPGTVAALVGVDITALVGVLGRSYAAMRCCVLCCCSLMYSGVLAPATELKSD
jgi:hypothetical protein